MNPSLRLFSRRTLAVFLLFNLSLSAPQIRAQQSAAKKRQSIGLVFEGGGALVARTLSVELLGRRIRVNAVSPGLIETPILRGVGQTEQSGQTEAQFRDYLAGAAAQIPIGRLGRPEEIAAAVKFLACAEAGYITGSVLKIDGGIF